MTDEGLLIADGSLSCDSYEKSKDDKLTAITCTVEPALNGHEFFQRKLVVKGRWLYNRRVK